MSAHLALVTVVPMLTASTTPVASAVSVRAVTSVMAETVKMLTSKPRTDDCDANATCINTDGGFSSSCNTGHVTTARLVMV